eukprot:TRINITY_DN15041_c0_g1_i1.p1 TRINITY_DN15041_c0_g1~~TRINITY_DN15041_c0_g1_i1.p1  ORF type:complete len:555 (+),score=112.59 TRINITY_DN15041_c0_g1_i1:23-1687(+)
MIILKLLLVASLLLLVWQPVRAETFRTISWQQEPNDWIKQDRAEPDQILQLIIGLRPRNAQQLEEKLIQVSSPKSGSYGKHLSITEIRDMVAPPASNVEKVYEWLSQASIAKSRVRPNLYEDMLELKLTVAEAENLLQTTYFNFKHAFDSSLIITRTPHYKLPESIHEIVDVVGPTFRFPNPLRSRTHAGSPYLSAQVITPDAIRQIYNVGNQTNASPLNLQAVASFLEQYYSPDDLALFFQNIVPSLIGVTPQLRGVNLPSLPGIEASLDIQYLMGIAEFVETIFWSTSGRQEDNFGNEPFLKFMYALGNDTNPPLVVSISYADYENTVDYEYANRVNFEFKKAGTQGITLLSGSGDGGVAGAQPQNCSVYVATFPAASPYITAVGGTTGGFSAESPEIAANLTGGGFSNYWNRPSYQVEAVDHYLEVASYLPPSSLYNQTGAGFPDVAAQSLLFNVTYKGEFILVDGTSCATPTFSSLVALLNGVRLSAGKSPLGYLNILFYENPSVFNDITYGYNPGCNTNGYTAAPGWDPLTGLGTPNFQSLLNLTMSLP